VSRNYNVFLVKNIIVMVMIVQAALCALRMNPLIPPLLGSRFGVMIFAMVLVALQSNSEAPKEALGSVSSLMWIDIFYLYHFLTLLAAVVETALVHTLIRGGHEPLALRIDFTFRNLLPLGLYWAGMVGITLIPVHGPAAGIGVGVGLFTAMLAGAYSFIRYRLRKFERARTALTQQLARSADDDLDGEDGLLRETFDLFDYDSSGDMDSKEVRSLLLRMYPRMPRERRQEVMSALKLNSTLAFEDFGDAVMALRKFVCEKDPDHEWHCCSTRRAGESAQSVTTRTLKATASLVSGFRHV